MRKLLLPLLILQPLLLLAQDSFIIEGKAPAIKDGNTVFLIYIVNDQKKVDSAPVQSGRFVLKGNLQYPVQATMSLNVNPFVRRPARGERVDMFSFYLEPARLKLISNDSLRNMKTVGSVINDLNAERKAMLSVTDKQFDALNKAYNALTNEQKNDKHLIDSLRKREQQILVHSYRIHLAFARKHPNSYLGLMSVSYAAPRPEVNKEAAKVYQQLSPALKNTPLAQSVKLLLAAPGKTAIGKKAPDFVQSTPDGKKVKLSDFRSKYVLLDFWASWCGPCRAENPNVVAMYSQYKDKGFTVLGVSLDQPGQKTAWVKAIEKDQLTWTQVSDLKGWENIVAKKYGVQAIPTNFLIDPSGKIVGHNLRGEDLQKKLAEIFANR